MLFNNWNISGCIKFRMLDNKTSGFDVEGDIPEGWSWQLLYSCNGNLNIVEMQHEENILSVIFTKEMLPTDGTYLFQLKATKDDLVKHTNIVKSYVNKSLSGDIKWPVIPTEFTQIEQVVKGYAESAKESSIKAENAAIHSPIIGENGNWLIWDFEKSEYVDSGKPASTPPITPDTAGKYLTNDGSKTEWGRIDISQSDWEQTDESAADYVKNRPFGNFEHHSIDFYFSGDYSGRVEKAPIFDELLNTVGEKTARIEADGNIYCQGTAVTVLDEADGGINITFTSDDKLNELVFFGHYGDLTSLTINKSNITWDAYNTYSLFIDGLTYTRYQKLSNSSVEGTLPDVHEKDYILVSGEDGSWVTRSIESINPIFQLSGASAGQIVKITAVDESGKPTVWEAVDMDGGGGGETWEKIADVALTADTSVYELANFGIYRKIKVILSRAEYVVGLNKTVWFRIRTANMIGNQYAAVFMNSDYGYITWEITGEIGETFTWIQKKTTNNPASPQSTIETIDILSPANPSEYGFYIDFTDTSVIQDGDTVAVYGVKR